MTDFTINSFRKRRGRILRQKIIDLARDLGRDIRILDVGGRPEYWQNINPQNVANICLLNFDEGELHRTGGDSDLFESRVGDARDLSDYDDNAFDLVHSNSVIEHVGLWPDMAAMAAEVQRVGKAGWLQTPAYEFPIEPHFRLPCIHWLGAPTRTSLLRLSRHYRNQDRAARRMHVERINLLSHREMRILFPDCKIWIERIILAKSYVAIW